MSDSGKIRVYLVDDVRELRALIRLALEEDPAIEVVGEAADGREGVEGVAEVQPDVALLDLSMPDMDGLEAIPLMRERAPGTRIVVLSGHEAGRISLEALEQGASRYVNKASDLADIRAAVHEVAAMDPPFTDERFGIVHEMWSRYLNGQVDEMLKNANVDAVWRPGADPGTELRSPAEVRDYAERRRAAGRVGDPRAYGVEPYRGALVVTGTLASIGPGGRQETEVHWVFCFSDHKVSLAAAYERREDAHRAIEESCAA